jgi:hypothetical protein
MEVQDLLAYSPLVRRQDWQTYRVKDGHKGPMVWRVKHRLVWVPDQRGLPDGPRHLLIAQNVLEPETIKFFTSNAPADTPVETLLLVAFSRWKIERAFEDGKGELGMDHFEVRQYGSMVRHLLLTCVSYLFLAEFHAAHRGEKSASHGGPGADGDVPPGPDLVVRGPMFAAVRRADQPADPADPTAQREGGTLPSEADGASIARHRPVSEGPTHVSVASFVAL